MSLLNFILTLVAILLIAYYRNITDFFKRKGMDRGQATWTFLGICFIVIIIRIIFKEF